MRSSRLTALVLLAGSIAGGLVIEAADDDPTPDRAGPDVPAVEAGVAMPAARGEPTLSSTWYCAGGTGAEGSRAEHGIILANPTDRPRTATITALSGVIAPAPVIAEPPPAGEEPSETTTTAPPTTTTAAPTTTVPAPPAQTTLELPAQSRVSYRLGELVDAKLVSAVVEVDGGEIAVDHEISGDLGRATAPCSTTASPTWTFPWGVTSRGARELLVFMNPFPDDATVDIDFATDEGVRETARFQGFVVPGRSVVGAYVDEDVTRKAQVSAHVQVRTGRLVVDRIQMFEGTDEDARRGITLGLGAPVPAETWMFPDGEHRQGIGEQVVVFNPSDGVAEVEVEVRLTAPEAPDEGEEGSEVVPPEPFALTVLPGRYSLISIPDPAQPDRVPDGVGHSLIVRSLNRVPVVAERVTAAVEPAARRGVGAVMGAPLGSPTWIFPGGGTSESRDEWLVLLNVSPDEEVTYRVTSPSGGRMIPLQDLQDVRLPPGGRAAIRLGDHIEREDLPILVTASGPIVAERGLFAVGGRGLSQSMGIPFAQGAVVPDTIDG